MVLLRKALMEIMLSISKASFTIPLSSLATFNISITNALQLKPIINPYVEPQLLLVIIERFKHQNAYMQAYIIKKMQAIILINKATQNNKKVKKAN